ncbi:MAG TPA: hypothetical protein PKN14_11115 [Bacteroidia bacterium]|nr:MAG: hypothetical protein UZ10_BCD003001945 [Bacteroidetes bacterium OLB10]MBE7510175.1 hypothetical protein [Bacteroidia bacterium]MBX3106782.1 hypothetical protein [Bacteroidota bacterium]MCE7956105.1 hypothetical protein [Bacteroidetes bacterium CHB6]OQB63782.1 MAG: hypothetical protein BWX95_00813 [Bacteroidetes bacterium ADurb.Bin141]
MSEPLKILMVILISSVKFVVGPAFAYYDDNFDFTFFEAVIYPVIGGMLGVFVFSFFSDQVAKLWTFIKNNISKTVGKKNKPFSNPTIDTDQKIKVNYTYVESKKENKPKIFTKRNRRIITLWRKYGLFGIAFITPVILSIPIGTIIASRLVSNRKKVFLFMFVSISFWSVLMVSSFELYHAYSIKALQQKMLEP